MLQNRRASAQGIRDLDQVRSRRGASGVLNM
jgi:hypothetical protein